jgi:hypothetical protein
MYMQFSIVACEAEVVAFGAAKSQNMLVPRHCKGEKQTPFALCRAYPVQSVSEIERNMLSNFYLIFFFVINALLFI